MGGYIIIIALIVLVVLLSRCIKIVSQTNAYVIERLGSYSATWGTGIHFKLPVIERIASKVSLKEDVLDFDPQPVITKDNVTMLIDTVIYFQVTDPKLATYGIQDPFSAIENLTATTIRNIVGDLDLDETLTSRDLINTKMKNTLDEATDPWGIKVNRVELKNITPPETIRLSMEKQMKAEREKRESILRAEGEKQSQILVAQGNKEAVILEAEAQKESAILAAEAQKRSAILEAEGQAEAILNVQKATADGIALINLSNPGQAAITLKSLEALVKVADGQSTKLIIPTELQGMASLAASFKEFVADNPTSEK